MENIKVLREESFDIEMPTKIMVGDPWYFETMPEREDLVYNRSFRGRKDWLGKLIIKETSDLDILEKFGSEFIEVRFQVIWAPRKEILETYTEGMVYSNQKDKIKRIGVDTATYILETNLGYSEIKTGSDGYMGHVLELYNGSKLEGIIIDLTSLDFYGFNQIKDELLYVFKEVK